MPTYEYVCEACEHEFETFQSITAKPLRKCPECEKPKLRRKIGTGVGIIFKGSGFYETDYRSESYKKAAKAEKEQASGKSSESKSDGKASKSDSGSSSGGDKAGNSSAKSTASTTSKKAD